MKQRTIKAGKNRLQALSWKISTKTLVVIKGRRGYIMCGYLNMKVADSFKDVAVIVTGVTSISGALRSSVAGVSKEAYKLGIRKNQPVKDVLEIIA
jgi:uncharacterized protein YunC (DUF1805 family)